MISAFQTTDEILTSYLSEVLNNSAQPLFFSLMQTPCICAHREHYGSQLQGVAVFHDEELLEIGKVSHPRRKTEKMVGKMLVKELLARKLKSPKLKTGSVRVLADSHPVRILSELSETNTAESINSTHASISHSGDFVFAAIGDRRLGIDFEVPRQLREGTLRYFLTAEELQWLEESVSKNQLPEYFDSNYAGLVYFTQKEAVLKAIGLGIAGGPSKVKLAEFKVGAEFVAEYEGLFFDILTLAGAQGILSLAKER